ncbi:hypothetical protein BD414DRAFT_415931 [Trametes punicea]|nr:hypothetical protein BD414DRAFT_415931 [Trametes punicea]
MHATLATIYGLLASLALCAPMASLDADTFLQNGKDAQILNAEFANLDASDACKSGEMACMGASVAHCVNGTWTAEACPKSLSCFALPSVREKGTVISCTSNATALVVISASGATGGIVANSTADPVDFPMDCDGDDDNDNDGDDSDSSASVVSATGTRIHISASRTASASTTFSAGATSATSSASGTGDAAGATVTITVTAPAPESTSTQFVETTTLDPSQASSFLSSIATDTNISIVTTILPTSAPAGSVSPSAAAAASSDAAQSSAFSAKPVGIASSPSFTSDFGAPTTITLLPRPSSASASSAPQATSAEAAVAGDGYSY